MRANEIKSGCIYLTRVQGESVRVRVYPRPGYRDGKTVFHCVRQDTNRPLPKLRKPSAIHPLPGTPEALREEKRAVKRAARPKPPRAPSEPHASMSCREYAAELRVYANACLAWSRARGTCDASEAEAKIATSRYIRRKLQDHLRNRATWLSLTVLRQSDDALRAARLYEKRKFGTSRMACQLAPMLGADPSVVDALISQVKR